MRYKIFEIYEADFGCEERPEIGLATVYRTIQLLWDMQLINIFRSQMPAFILLQDRKDQNSLIRNFQPFFS